MLIQYEITTRVAYSSRHCVYMTHSNPVHSQCESYSHVLRSLCSNIVESYTKSIVNGSWGLFWFIREKLSVNTYTFCLMMESLFILCRAYIGRRLKTFWSWWCLAQPALLSQMMCSALIAQNRVALQKLPLLVYSTTLLRSFLERPWISTLTSQKSVSSVS